MDRWIRFNLALLQGPLIGINGKQTVVLAAFFYCVLNKKRFFFGNASSEGQQQKRVALPRWGCLSFEADIGPIETLSGHPASVRR